MVSSSLGLYSLFQVMYLPLPHMHHPVHLQLLPHQKTALETDDLHELISLILSTACKAGACSASRCFWCLISSCLYKCAKLVSNRVSPSFAQSRNIAKDEVDTDLHFNSKVLEPNYVSKPAAGLSPLDHSMYGMVLPNVATLAFLMLGNFQLGVSPA